jgi:hypothetical protein
MRDRDQRKNFIADIERLRDLSDAVRVNGETRRIALTLHMDEMNDNNRRI